MKKVLLIAAVLTSVKSYTATLDTPSGYYPSKTTGFYLKHFDRSPDPDTMSASCTKFGGLLVRGGRPLVKDSNAWLENLTANNVKLVVDLRNESTDYTATKNKLLAENISIIKLPLKTEGKDQDLEMTVEESHPGADSTKTKMPRVDATISVIVKVQEALARGERVYIHCQRGEDRTGTFIALLRGCTDWKKEFSRYGGSSYPALTTHFKAVTARLATED